MKTIETKIAKNGAITVKVNGKRSNRQAAQDAIIELSTSGAIVKFTAENNNGTDVYTGTFDGEKSCYVFTDNDGTEYEFLFAAEAVKALAKHNFVDCNVTINGVADNEEISEVDAAEYAITAEAQDSAVESEIENAEAAKIERELAKLEKMTATSATAALEILNGLLPENHLHFVYVGTSNIAGVTYRHFDSIGTFGGATHKRMIEVVKADKLDAVILVDESRNNEGTEIKIVDESEIELANVEEKAAVNEIKIETKIAANFTVKTLVNGKKVERYDAVKIARENNLHVYEASYLNESGNGNNETFATAIAAYAWLKSKARSNRNIGDGSLTVIRNTYTDDALFGDYVYDNSGDEFFSDDEPELKAYAEAREAYDHIKDRTKLLQIKASQMVADGMTQEQAEAKIVRDILGIKTDEEIAAEKAAERAKAEKATAEYQKRRAERLSIIANANIAETNLSDGARKYFKKQRGMKFLVATVDWLISEHRYGVQDDPFKTFEQAVEQIEFIADCKAGTASPWAIKNIDGQILASGRDFNEFAEWLDDREDDTAFSLLPDVDELNDVDDEPEIETVNTVAENITVADKRKSYSVNPDTENTGVKYNHINVYMSAGKLSLDGYFNCKTMETAYRRFKKIMRQVAADIPELEGWDNCWLDAAKITAEYCDDKLIGYFNENGDMIFGKDGDLTLAIEICDDDLFYLYGNFGQVYDAPVPESETPANVDDRVAAIETQIANIIAENAEIREALYDAENENCTPDEETPQWFIDDLNYQHERNMTEYWKLVAELEAIKAAKLNPPIDEPAPDTDTDCEVDSPDTDDEPEPDPELDELYHELDELNELRDACLKSPIVKVRQLQALGNAIERLELEIDDAERRKRDLVFAICTSGEPIIDEFGEVWF